MIDLVKLPLRQTESEFSAVEQEALQSASDTAIVDVRGWLKFGEGHFPGSWNIGLESADFVASARIFVQRKSRILLVSEDYGQAHRARLKLLRAGFRHIEGFIEAHELTAFHRITQLAAADLRSTLSRGGKPALLDVRSSKEYQHSAGDIARPILGIVNIEAVGGRLSRWLPKRCCFQLASIEGLRKCASSDRRHERLRQCLFDGIPARAIAFCSLSVMACQARLHPSHPRLRRSLASLASLAL
jgi:rhodanese-related sulfurtransferase